MRSQVYDVLEVGDRWPRIARIVGLATSLLVVVNISAVILETVKPIAAEYGTLFSAIERVSLAVFLLEYLARLWACTASPSFQHPLLGRLRYAATPAALVDLLAILPGALQLGALDLRRLRLIRVVRIIRILKLGRYSKALQIMGRVVKATYGQLLVALFLVIVLMIFSSSAMYFVEHQAQPDAFSSIPATMWWAIATLTTVGYGDVLPVTILGKFLGSVIALLGIGLFALPTGILGSAFVEELSARSEAPHCPNCGHRVR